MASGLTSGDFDRLEKTLLGWRVVVSEGVDKKLTAYSTAEPLFCVTRDSIDALKDAVRKVLKSYLSTFYGLTDGNVIINEEQIEKVLPIETVVPIKRFSLKPLERGDLDEPRYAVG